MISTLLALSLATLVFSDAVANGKNAKRKPSNETTEAIPAAKSVSLNEIESGGLAEFFEEEIERLLPQKPADAFRIGEAMLDVQIKEFERNRKAWTDAGYLTIEDERFTSLLTQKILENLRGKMARERRGGARAQQSDLVGEELGGREGSLLLSRLNRKYKRFVDPKWKPEEEKYDPTRAKFYE